MQIEKKLEELDIQLPCVAKPIANFLSFVRTGNLIFISGQGPFEDGKCKYLGKLGDTIDNETGYRAAHLAAINLIAVLKTAVGDLDLVNRIVSLRGFVNCTDSFTEQPQIINGASDLFVEVFGEKGRHARCALGTNALPLGICVEIELVVEISDQCH